MKKKKCEKTMSGVHLIKERLFIPQGMNIPLNNKTFIANSDCISVKMCVYCGLIDDKKA